MDTHTKSQQPEDLRSAAKLSPSAPVRVTEDGYEVPLTIWPGVGLPRILDLGLHGARHAHHALDDRGRCARERGVGQFERHHRGRMAFTHFVAAKRLDKAHAQMARAARAQRDVDFLIA